MVTAEDLVQSRIAELGEWLSAQELAVGDDKAQGSRDRLTWHYGYLVGLQEALKVLTSQGATLH